MCGTTWWHTRHALESLVSRQIPPSPHFANLPSVGRLIMNLRLAWGASALLVWMGCGGAFTTVDPGADAGPGGSTTGGAGTSSTGAGGSSGVGGSSSGVGGTSSGVGGDVSSTGGSNSGAGGGSAGMSGGTGGSGGNRGPDWSACDGPGQCVAMVASCCG